MSKTDHPRRPGSHHVVTSAERWLDRAEHWSEVDKGFRKPVILARTEVNEHVMTEEAVKPRLCKFCRKPLTELADWERDLLGPDYDETVEPEYDFCDYQCLEDHANFESMGLTWKTTDDQLETAEMLHASSMLRDEIDDEPGWDDTAWLPLVTIEEAREIFGGDFVIDGRNAENRYKKPAGALHPMPVKAPMKAWWQR